MAELIIDAKVTGLNEVKQLDKAVDDLGVSTKRSNASLVGWTAGLTATAYAFSKVAEAGHEYLTNLEDINNVIVTTTELENSLSTSFGMMSASILEQTGLWDAYRESLVMATNALDALAGAEAIRAKAKADHEAMEKEHQADLKTRHEEKMKFLEDEAKAGIASLKLQQRADREYEEAQKKQRDLVEATAKAKAEAYEAELKALDDAIDAINAETEAQIANSQATEDNTEATEENTTATEANTKASQANASANGYSSTVDAYTQLQLDHQYATSMQMQGYDMTAELARQNQLLADLYEVNRDTNEQIGGY